MFPGQRRDGPLVLSLEVLERARDIDGEAGDGVRRGLRGGRVHGHVAFGDQRWTERATAPLIFAGQCARSCQLHLGLRGVNCRPGHVLGLAHLRASTAMSNV
jgi:hypothetical protein